MAMACGKSVAAGSLLVRGHIPRTPIHSGKPPFHDSIATLRDKQAPYTVIAELLQQNGVKPAGRVWPNTAASFWKAVNRASDGSGRKPRQPQIASAVTENFKRAFTTKEIEDEDENSE
jgi:hypothetical protein